MTDYLIIDLETVDPSKTLREILDEKLQHDNNDSQQKLPQDKDNNINNKESSVRKYFCNNTSCKKEITKDVVAFCLFKDEYGRTRFNGKVYCKVCQEKM